MSFSRASEGAREGGRELEGMGKKAVYISRGVEGDRAPRRFQQYFGSTLAMQRPTRLVLHICIGTCPEGEVRAGFMADEQTLHRESSSCSHGRGCSTSSLAIPLALAATVAVVGAGVASEIVIVVV